MKCKKEISNLVDLIAVNILLKVNLSKNMKRIFLVDYESFILLKCRYYEGYVVWSFYANNFTIIFRNYLFGN